jgi:predicted HAD superfamily Cof-like phosphohydrolase
VNKKQKTYYGKGHLWGMHNVTNFTKVSIFMKAMGQDQPEKSVFPDDKIVNLRLDLIDEECRELKDAVEAKDIVEVADALTDLLYVVYGAGHAFGINLDLAFNNVHASNMSKLGEDGKPIYREDGKVLKGPNYFPPKIKRALTL